jgi:hypothetical protein
MRRMHHKLKSISAGARAYLIWLSLRRGLKRISLLGTPPTTTGEVNKHDAGIFGVGEMFGVVHAEVFATESLYGTQFTCFTGTKVQILTLLT